MLRPFLQEQYDPNLNNFREASIGLLAYKKTVKR